LKTFCIFFAIFCAWFAYRRFERQPITYPPGVLILDEPAQAECADAPFDDGAFHLKPLATFELSARVLHTKRYRYDAGASLVPVDLAVGWGPMSDQSVLDQLSITQSMRFFWYEYPKSAPIPQDQIVRHSTNVHIIPANTTIAKRVENLRTGELVHLRGRLVEANGPNIPTWRSSLRRDDTGNGACELMYLEEISDAFPSEKIRD
jgi:hypothetical protein